MKTPIIMRHEAAMDMALWNLCYMEPEDLQELINNNPVWLADDEEAVYRIED